MRGNRVLVSLKFQTLWIHFLQDKIANLRCNVSILKASRDGWNFKKLPKGSKLFSDYIQVLKFENEPSLLKFK